MGPEYGKIFSSKEVVAYRFVPLFSISKFTPNLNGKLFSTIIFHAPPTKLIDSKSIIGDTSGMGKSIDSELGGIWQLKIIFHLN